MQRLLDVIAVAKEQYPPIGEVVVEPEFRNGHPPRERIMELTLRSAGLELIVARPEFSKAPPDRWKHAEMWVDGFRWAAERYGQKGYGLVNFHNVLPATAAKFGPLLEAAIDRCLL